MACCELGNTGAHTHVVVSVLQSILDGSRVQLPACPMTLCKAHLPTGPFLRSQRWWGGNSKQKRHPQICPCPPPALVLLPIFCCLPGAAGSLLLLFSSQGMSSFTPALLPAVAARAGTCADTPGWVESGSFQHWYGVLGAWHKENCSDPS